MSRKGYWIAQLDVTDADAFVRYQAAVEMIFRDYHGRFLARGGRSHGEEGHQTTRVVIVEFDDYKTALRCYLSSEFEQANVIRDGSASGHVVVVEGYDGPQP